MPINRDQAVFNKLTKRERDLLGIRQVDTRTPEEQLERQTGQTAKDKREAAEKLKRPAVGEWE